jgi:hypothetical protein
MPKGMPGEIPEATLRRQNPGVIAAAVAGRRVTHRRNRRSARMFGLMGMVPSTRLPALPATTQRKLNLRRGWPVSHPGLGGGAVGRRVEQA